MTDIHLDTTLDNIKNDVLWQPYRKKESESGESSEELKNTGSPWVTPKKKDASLEETGWDWSNRKPNWRKPKKTEEAEEGIGNDAVFYGVAQRELWWWIRNTAFAKTRNGKHGRSIYTKLGASAQPRLSRSQETEVIRKSVLPFSLFGVFVGTFESWKDWSYFSLQQY